MVSIRIPKKVNNFYTFYENRSSVSGNRWFQSNPTTYVCMKLVTLNVAYSM